MYNRGLMVQNRGCARTHKIATAMSDIDWKMSLVQKGNQLPLWSSNNYEFIISMGEYECTDCWPMVLESLVNNLDRWDVVHSSNSPDGYSWYLVTNSKTPVIHDCHDAITAMRHSMPKDFNMETIVNQRANGVIYVSEEQREYMIDNHNIDKNKTIIFPNYGLEKFITNYPKPKASDMMGDIHLVYEGGIWLGGDQPTDPIAHRNIWPLFKALIKQGIHVHIYRASGMKSDKYLPMESPLLHWHGVASLPTLMREMTQYDAGIIAFDRTYEESFEHALCNKMFEYVGAGLPILCDDAEATVNWVNKYKIGEPAFAKWQENGIDKISFNNIEPYLKNVEKYKHVWTMEKHIGKLEKFYKKVAKRGR